MSSIITNENAIVALQTLRSVTANLQETQDRISTGLEVRQASDNPAFFLVANQVGGDLAVITGIRDNLELTIQATATAQNAASDIFDELEAIQTTNVTADSGVARDELAFSLQNTVSFIEGVINTANFAGNNLLAGSDTFTVTTAVTRVGGEFTLSTFTLQRQNLDDISIGGDQFLSAGAGSDFDFMVGANDGTRQADEQFSALSRAFRGEGLATQFDRNNNGAVEFTSAGVANGGDFFTSADGIAGLMAGDLAFEGSRADAAFLLSVGIQATFIAGGATDETGETIDIVSFARSGLSDLNTRTNGQGVATSEEFASALVDANVFTTEVFDAANREILNADQETLSFLEMAGFTMAVLTGTTITLVSEESLLTPATIDFAGQTATAFETAAQTVLENFVLDSGRLLEQADASGFSGVLRQIDITAETGNVGSAITISASLVDRANLVASNVGTLQSTLEARQNFLSDLADSLDVGIAALIEANLDEESTRLQAQQVQQQLAIQSLTIANAQPQVLLQLFA